MVSPLDIGTIYKVTLIETNETALLRYDGFNPIDSLHHFRILGIMGSVPDLEARKNKNTTLNWTTDMFPKFNIVKATEAEVILWSFL